ncbi:sugar ABC transporter permease [Thermotoga sp. KOL6]|uniref:sugar ABC transporter permease n=1 Tax=Thermotoga sp. KOL6 TaxID=126741 RepID=UPI000C7944A2|nr:sugar ABC transporter permease [Thermotoga sp. KOL6]PLV60450.1 maltose ABC transporter permease [Thermotoga sp. KOL6]
MMVRKKSRWLTHVLLVILIIVVLFPIVWVVSTSFRRDEAAFSPKLFSSRLTLQHYKDLIAPEKNLPVLVQEMQSLVSRAEPFNKVSREKAEELIEDRIKKFENYLNETEELIQDSYDAYSKISNALSERIEDVKLHISSVLEKIEDTTKKELEKSPIPETRNLSIAIYEKLNGKSIRTTEYRALKDDLERLVGYPVDDTSSFKEALFDLELIYNREIGLLKDDLKKLEGEISTLQSELSKFERQKLEVEEEIIERQKILNVLKPDVESVVSILKDLERMLQKIQESEVESTFSYDDATLRNSLSTLIPKLKAIYTKISGYSDLEELSFKIEEMTNLLERMAKLLENDENLTKKVLYKNFVQSFGEVVPTVEGIIEKLDDGIEEFINKAKKLKSLNNEIVFLKAKIEGLQKKVRLMEEALSEKEQMVSQAKRYVDLKVFVLSLEEKKDTLESIKSFNNATQIKLLSVYKVPKGFVSYYISEHGNDDFIGKIREMTKKLSWVEDYREFSRRMETGYKNALKVLEDSRKVLNDFKNGYSELLNLSFKGVFVSSEHLQMLYDLVKMDFVQKVLTNTAVASRKAGTLMDTFPLKELKDDFKKIDGNLYRIAQMWEQKTKHYFLRWVMNSVIVAGLVSLITTTVCALAAYPFSRMRFWGRQYGIMALLLIQMFPAIMYMVAIYGLLKLIGQFLPFLGLDSLGGLIFAYLGNIAYNMYLIKGFYDTIPSSLEEAAMIDGATRFQTFYKIVVPLALPILTVIVILTFIGTFNEFVLARIILQDVKNYTYALGLWTFSTGAYETEWGLFTAAALLGMTPMVILFLSLQKYIVGGLTKGSVKG